MNFLSSRSRLLSFIFTGLVIALIAFGSRGAYPWNLLAEDSSSTTATLDSPEIPFELLYSRKGSVYRNLRYAIESEDEARAMALVQSILDDSEDHFVSTESGRVVSLKRLALDYLESLPRNSLRQYQRQWDLDADVLLEEARESGKVADYTKILDRYYFTDSGFEAVDWLAMRSLDLGQFHTASRLWNDVIDSSVHAHRVGPQLLMKAAIANRLAGDGERAAELMTRLVSTETGRELSLKLENYLKSQTARKPGENTTPDSTLVGTWKLSLTESLNEQERELLDEWRRAAWVDRKTLSVARSGVAEGNLLAIRGYDRILLLDRLSGQPRASYSVSPSLEEAVAEYEEKQFIANRWEPFESKAEFLEEFVWNTLHSQLSHDQRYVYVVEKDDQWMQRNRPNGVPQSTMQRRNQILGNRGFGDPSGEPIPTNRLVALPLKTLSANEESNWEPVWEINAWEKEHPEFQGVYFLSLPVNVDGVLYAVVEQEETIKLFCLDPSNGKLLWSQGLGFPMNSLYEDSSRRWRGCVVRPAGDKLIITTQVGLIVGIDPVGRVLEWVYYLGDTRNRRRFAFRGQELDMSYGSLGFVDEPVISGHQLFLLPRQSSELHCVDHETGHLLWKQPRNKPTSSSDESQGDEYLGGISGEVLLVVGARETRGLSAADGRELWRINHARISGRGVQQQDSYLLPLENSRILRIRISDGEKLVLNLNPEARVETRNLSGISGDQSIKEHPAPLPRFGHLLVSGRHLISLGIDSLIALPEPESHLAALEILAAAGELDNEQMFEYITLNSELSSRERITGYEELIAKTLPEPLRERVENEYEQELFRWMRQHPEDVAMVSEKLAPFQQTPDDEIRLAINLSHQQMELGDPNDVLETLRQLGRLQSDSLFEMPGDPKLSLSLGAWMRTIWDWSRYQPNRDAFDSYLTGRIQSALASNESPELRNVLEHFPGLPELDEVRLTLASKSQQEQRYHEAEMLLMTVAEHQESVRSVAAMVELAGLWSRFGLYDRAADMLKQADSRISGPWPSGLKAQRLAIQDSNGMQQAMANLQIPTREISQVTVSSLLPGAPQRMISEAYEGYRRIYPTPPECDFDLLAKSHPDNNNNKHMLHIVSRSKGTVAAKVELPLRGSAGSSSRDSVVGHFFPFGSMGQIRGLSLMDTSGGGPIWTRSFLDPEMGEMLFVGPFSSEFVTFRHQDAMLVADSINGKVLWRRDELEPQQSSNSNPRVTLFGDERVIVRRPKNENSEDNYEVYETFTGRLLESPDVPRTGLLGSVGRLLVMLRYGGDENSPADAGRRPSVSVVDMETGAEVFASRYWSPHCSHLDGDRLVLIDHEKQLRVIDLKTREEIVSIPTEFGESASVTRLNYLSDAANHYINIRRVDDHQRVREEGGDRIFSNFASNPFLPSTDVVGLLIAVDKQTGRRRWDRIMSSCSVVESPHEALPFLTTLSWRVQQRVPNTRRLHVEVLSLENGGTLGYSDDFVPLDQFMQLFQSRYDRQRGLFELNGPMYRVQIEFNDRWNRFLPEPGPS